MAYSKKPKKGWYLLKNPSKFIKPKDSHMKSFKDISDSKTIKYAVEYKSGLELSAFRYADCNPSISSWSVEPFPIQYIKPTDNKPHRYYIDLLIRFVTGDMFLVEVKPDSQTKMPRKPKGMKNNTSTPKALNRYKNDVMTYMINQAKWDAAINFGKKHNMKFVTMTEKHLKG